MGRVGYNQFHIQQVNSVCLYRPVYLETMAKFCWFLIYKTTGSSGGKNNSKWEVTYMMKIYRSRKVLSTGVKPSALGDNPLDLHNSSYHTQPRAIIAQ